MQGKSPNPAQLNCLYSNLLEQLNPKHPLLQLAKQLPWDLYEDELAPLYASRGRPAKPIRLMVGLTLLKHLDNLSDEQLIERWVRDPYYQSFCGEVEFQWAFPCTPSEMTHFRQRLGEAGHELLFASSVALHGEAVEEQEVCIDSTVQEKNITYPTDDKLYLKVISRCHQLAKKHAIALRRSYRRELKQLKLALRYRSHPKLRVKARRAQKRLRTIAGVLVRELQRKLPEDVLLSHAEDFALYARVIEQRRTDKNKVYSLHEPHVYCMSKGKAHKRYEFGTKASITKTKDSNIIVGAIAHERNQHDNGTLTSVFEQVKRIRCQMPILGLCDRGYRGRKQVAGVEIQIPGRGKASDTRYQRDKTRKRFRRRASIEPVIGHLKSDHRLGRNFLKGFLGDQINVLMAACAFNLRKWLREVILYFMRSWQGLLSGSEALMSTLWRLKVHRSSSMLHGYAG